MGGEGKVRWKFENVTIFPMGKKVKEWKFIFGVYKVMDNLHTSIVNLLCTCIHIPVLQREMWFVDCSYIHAYTHTSAETNSDFCYSNSCFLNDQIPNNLCTHTETHASDPCMHASTHACTRTHADTQSSCGRWHAQLAVNLLFANNLKVFPYRTPQRPTSRFTWARLTIQLRHVEHQVRANYIITRIFVYVLWHSNSTVMIKYSIVSALIYTHIHCTCKHDLSLRTY